MTEIEDQDCPNCDDGGDLFQQGPFVGCNDCSGMWAPSDIVESSDMMDQVPGDSL